ncbi:MAG: DNA-directed RNA polymerase subunit omega [Candidatus Hydrogenedentes bacterium]|nr:DNA-directed RNA polymerase subunit omega [Candidatus Hydrogenedentota bacterium]
MERISIEDFDKKVDSLYRLVLLGARRAGQLAKPDSRSLVPAKSKKPTIVALQEILGGKVTYKTGVGDEEDLVG